MTTDQAPAPGVIGNERLTASAGGALLFLLTIELATAAVLRVQMSAHVFIGVLLVGPLLLKLGSTGYRFVRYYTHAIPYVRKGPPDWRLRVLAIPLVATTILLVGSGGALLLTGPTRSGQLIAIHNISTLIWLPLVAVHAVAYLRRLPRLVLPDVRQRLIAQGAGRVARLGASIGCLVLGAVAAAIALPTAVPWIGWAQSNEQIPAPIIVGAVLTVAALAVGRPARWTSKAPPDPSPTA